MTISSLSKLSSDLFAPIQTASTPSRPKSVIDHVKDYVGSTSGAWDFFRALDYAISPWKFTNLLSESSLEQVHRISGVVGTAGASLCMPTLVTDAIGLKRSVDDLTHIHQCPTSDPERSKKIAQAYKKTVINGADLGYTFCQSSRFLNEANVIALGSSLPVFSGVQQVCGIVSDGNELIEESYKLHNYQADSSASTDQEKSLMAAKKNLSWLKIAKDIPSIAMSALALVGIFFASVASSPVVPIIFLSLSVSWLTFKVSSYFYENIVVADRQARVARPV